MTRFLQLGWRMGAALSIAALCASGLGQVKRGHPPRRQNPPVARRQPGPVVRRQAPLPPRAAVNFAKFGKGLLSKIDLSNEQRNQIQEAARPHFNALQEVNRSNAAPAEKQARRREIMRNLQQEVESILTPSQRQRLRELMKENRQKQKGGGGGEY